MNVTTYMVAPHGHLERHEELTRSLDALFRRYHVPPAILQHSFVDRRPCVRYTETLNLLTPFPTHPSSELLQDIGRTVSPLQSRFIGLQSSYYSPVFPPVPTGVYAPNEDHFIITRSAPKLLYGPDISYGNGDFETTFESRLQLHHGLASETHSTLQGSLSLKTNPDKRGTTLTISSPSLRLRSSPSTNHHPYTLHSLSASARRDPTSPGPCTLTPHFGGTRDRRFERTCNGLRHDCTWNWEVLDDQLQAHGVDQSEAGKSLGERITIDIPRAGVCTAPRPLSVYFTATLGATAGLDAIDSVHRTHWAPQAMQSLQNAFDRAHPAIQILHHIVRIDIPDLGSMINAGVGDIHSSRSDTDSDPGVNASRENFWTGELRVALNQDAGLLGRRGDEDEDGNSDEDSD